MLRSWEGCLGKKETEKAARRHLNRGLDEAKPEKME